jgi:predicted ABC-type ATPase
MDIQKLSNEIATLKRAVKEAATAPLKEKLRKKIALLDQNIKDANIPAKKLAMMLLGAKRKVAAYTQAEFNAVIKRLSNKDEYYFLKGLTKVEIKDDLERHAKNPGWRFKGRGNYKTPTKKDLINDMGKPATKRKTYYENRSNRSDVTNPAKLKDGGGIEFGNLRNANANITKKQIKDKIEKRTKLEKLIEAKRKGSKKTVALGGIQVSLDTAIDYYKKLRYATGGGVGDDQLNIVFSRQDVFEKAKDFYENESAFYPSDVNDEFRTFVFDIENGEADVTEYYIDQELQDTDLDGYYFEIADKMQTGGGVENENKEMVLNNAQQIEHHAEELENAAKKSKHVPAWVVAKVYNASSNISDATHYLDGVNTMPKEHFERIHEEVENHKMETGGGVDSFLGKQMHIAKICKNHGCSTKDYFNAKNKYIQVGDLNDLFKKKVKGGAVGDTCEIFDSKGKRAIDKDSIEKLTKCVTALPQTKSDNINENGNYTEKRTELHKKIINKFKKDVVCITKGKPIAVLMGGSPASGKSTFLKKYRPYLLSESLFKVDADEIRAELPEYKGWNATQTHEEAGDIVNTLISDKNIGVPCNFDFIFDGTMSSVKRYNILIHNLRKENYQIYIVFMSNISKEEVKRRALERYRDSGRFVPMFVIDEFYANGEKNLNELKSMVDGYIVVDASSPNYRIIEQGGKKLPNKRLYEKLGEKIKLANGGGTGGTSDSAEMNAPTLGGTMTSSMATGGAIENEKISPTNLKRNQKYFAVAIKSPVMEFDITYLGKDKNDDWSFVIGNNTTGSIPFTLDEFDDKTKEWFNSKNNTSKPDLVIFNNATTANQYYADLWKNNFLGKVEKSNKMATGGATKKEFIANKVGKVMREFKEGDLHIGKSNKIVKNPKQAIAIGLSEGNKGWKNKKNKQKK